MLKIETPITVADLSEMGTSARREIARVVNMHNRLVRALREASPGHPLLNLADDVVTDALTTQEERACRAEDALAYLVDQIRKTSPVDDHGHALKTNLAFIKAVDLLSAIDNLPSGGTTIYSRLVTERTTIRAVAQQWKRDGSVVTPDPDAQP